MKDLEKVSEKLKGRPSPVEPALIKALSPPVRSSQDHPNSILEASVSLDNQPAVKDLSTTSIARYILRPRHVIKALIIRLDLLFEVLILLHMDKAVNVWEMHGDDAVKVSEIFDVKTGAGGELAQSRFVGGVVLRLLG